MDFSQHNPNTNRAGQIIICVSWSGKPLLNIQITSKPPSHVIEAFLGKLKQSVDRSGNLHATSLLLPITVHT